ncbi:MAG: FAD-dependent monooxygenase [Synechococcaceae cyanobacterium]|nr:FAD-dependent monooxygenase [Synechococcaceae cyanobacterium]
MLIVGAGPAGAALALQLAGRGLAVTVVEASRRFELPFRGQGLMPSGLEALAELGLPARPAAAEPAEAWPAMVPRRALRGWSFVVDGRPLFTVPEPMGSPVPCTLIEPGALLRHWRQRLQARGVPLLVGQPVTGLLEGGDRVTGVRLADGRCLHASLVVGCDGQESAVRRLSGLACALEPAPFALLWFRLRRPACGPIEAWLADRFVTLVGASGSGALFCRADGGVQVGWAPVGAPEAVPWPERWAAAAPPELAALLRALPVRAVRGPARRLGRVGLAERWHRPGLLLLGDAAHPMSPLRAQGLNMALRDAVVAAAALAPALAEPQGEPRQRALDAALARIEAARRPELRVVQALQAEEAQRAALLQNRPALRALLAATAPWSGPLLARRWRASQRVLRHGLAPLHGLERR